MQILFGISLFCNIFLGVISVEEDWILVPRSEVGREFFEEEESLEWVVLSKFFLDERFYVRFPSDPIYFYEDGRGTFVAQDGEKLFCLSVELRESFRGMRTGSAQENVILTEKNVYILQSDGTPEEHQRFVSSLVIM